MTTATVRKYACSLCGKKSTADRMVYSTFTGQRYCGREFRACFERAAKKKATA